MSDEHENFHQDTGTPEPPLPASDLDLLWQELVRTNSTIKNLQRQITAGLGSLAHDLGMAERQIQAFAAEAAQASVRQAARQRQVDRFVWAALALAACHLLLDAVRLLRRSERSI